MNKMKVAIFGSILMFLLSFNVIPSISAEPELGGGRISLVQGQVLMQAKDEGEWTEASINYPVADGDRIMTERNGRVELQLKNGTYVRIGETSQLDIIALSVDRGKAFIHLNQLEGKIYVNHRPVNEEASPLYIDLPYGVLSAFVPTRFRINLTSSEARISVLEGNVEFKSDGRPLPLTQGKTLIAKEGGYAEVAQLYGRDEWDRWNEARDNELFQKRYAQTYLPPDLEPWGYEMEGNGRWIYTPEYQYVWVPTIVVGWTPFHYGHWAWRRGIYCWVPREPWGWIPFHYGRWVRHHHHGWAWVPPFRHAAIWNPGAVAWHIGPKHVSWVPLAPGEIYYGHRYYGPHSININRVNINIQKNAYINARIKDAVVTVQNDSFNRKNPARITHVENPFLNPVKASIPPREKPAFLDGKKTPLRPIKESFERVQPEGKPSPKEWRTDAPSTERGPKVIERRRMTESPERRTVSETTRNRVERIKQPNRQAVPTQGNLVKKDSTPVPTRERTRVESPNPVPQSPQRNTSVNVNQNRFEQAGQSNSSQSLPTRQEGKAFSGRTALPEVRSSPAPSSKEQVVQPDRGSAGGLLGTSPMRSFR